MTPLIILVGADKGGVGKTTITRALLDWLDEHLPRTESMRVFDTQQPLGDLKKYRLGVDVVDITTIEDQMVVFDGIENVRVTVVDVCAGQLSPVLEMMERGGLLRDVATGKMRMVVLHILGSTIASMEEIGEVVSRIGGGAVRHLLVKNHYNDAKFRAASDPKYAEMLSIAKSNTIDVPLLPSQAREEIDDQRSGYAQFIKSINPLGENLEKKNSRVLVGYAACWLSDVFAELDRIGMANALSD